MCDFGFCCLHNAHHPYQRWCSSGNIWGGSIVGSKARGHQPTHIFVNAKLCVVNQCMALISVSNVQMFLLFQLVLWFSSKTKHINNLISDIHAEETFESVNHEFWVHLVFCSRENEFVGWLSFRGELNCAQPGSRSTNYSHFDCFINWNNQHNDN